MRRVAVFLSVGIVVLLGILGLHAQPVAVAQEATPSADMEMEEGITFESLAFAGQVDVTGPLDFYVARVTLAPGKGFTNDPGDPTVGILLVESGTFTVQIDGPVTVTRAGTLDTAMATAEATGDTGGIMEDIAAGEAVTLTAGDAAFIPGNVGGEIRNDGDELAVGLGFLAFPSEGMMGEATPAP